MKNSIRTSVTDDVKDFVKLKNQLSLPTSVTTSTKGGFLLGTNESTYRFYINQGICFTARKEDNVIGFGIALSNDIVRKGELWQKRKEVDWTIDIKLLERSNVAYIEQLAFLAGNKKLAIVLAYHLINKTFNAGADYVLTTTVRKPILNLAAVPLIKAAGGSVIGNIDENYPGFDQINSDIYLIKKEDFYKNIEKLKIYSFLKSNEV
jgi:hypothetical protein